tara:strand:- start:8779 stop:9009 length:231 start_codon:yes stop_codon:yes gene_type:complete
MKDLNTQRLLDAKLELGTEVQFFELSFDKICAYNTILGGLTALSMLLLPSLSMSIFCAYIGAFVMLTFFYIKFGTN